MNNAIKKLGIIDRKKAEEKEFLNWVQQSEVRKQKYGNVLSKLEEAYTKAYPYSRAAAYLRESLFSGVEMPRIASQIQRLSEKNITTELQSK